MMTPWWIRWHNWKTYPQWEGCGMATVVRMVRDLSRAEKMITWITVMLRKIVSPCVFGHEPRVYERDPGGFLVLVCPRCRDARRVQFAVR